MFCTSSFLLRGLFLPSSPYSFLLFIFILDSLLQNPSSLLPLPPPSLLPSPTPAFPPFLRHVHKSGHLHMHAALPLGSAWPQHYGCQRVRTSAAAAPVNPTPPARRWPQREGAWSDWPDHHHVPQSYYRPSPNACLTESLSESNFVRNSNRSTSNRCGLSEEWIRLYIRVSSYIPALPSSFIRVEFWMQRQISALDVL